MTLHDWIDELCDALDIETEVDEGLGLDLAKDAADKVERPAAPITAYLLGYAAAQRGGRPEQVEQLAEAATALAESWGGAKSDEGDEGDFDADILADVDDEELVDAE